MVPKLSNHTQTPLGALKDAIVKEKFQKAFHKSCNIKDNLICPKQILQVETKNKMKKKVGNKLKKVQM